jgi:phosphoribosylglycinamide formyltransferase-1
MIKLAVFASGSGSNAQRIAEYFANHPSVSVDIILTNNKNAFVIERAKSLNIPYTIFNRVDFYETDKVLNELKERQTDLIILAGFLWLVPTRIIQAYNGRILNIHPALLPKYGGKGMYGEFVHRAVITNKEKCSGITIHYVNEHYDQGDIIFQAQCIVEANDTSDSLAVKVHSLEYEHFPRVIEEVINKLQIP